VRPGQKYFFEWWFVCPNKKCRSVWHVEEAKRWVADVPDATVSHKAKLTVKEQLRLRVEELERENEKLRHRVL
jgi:hypothetical protein